MRASENTVVQHTTFSTTQQSVQFLSASGEDSASFTGRRVAGRRVITTTFNGSVTVYINQNNNTAKQVWSVQTVHVKEDFTVVFNQGHLAICQDARPCHNTWGVAPNPQPGLVTPRVQISSRKPDDAEGSTNVKMIIRQVQIVLVMDNSEDLLPSIKSAKAGEANKNLRLLKLVSDRSGELAGSVFERESERTARTETSGKIDLTDALSSMDSERTDRFSEYDDRVLSKVPYSQESNDHSNSQYLKQKVFTLLTHAEHDGFINVRLNVYPENKVDQSTHRNEQILELPLFRIDNRNNENRSNLFISHRFISSLAPIIELSLPAATLNQPSSYAPSGGSTVTSSTSVVPEVALKQAQLPPYNILPAGNPAGGNNDRPGNGRKRGRKWWEEAKKGDEGDSSFFGDDYLEPLDNE